MKRPWSVATSTPLHCEILARAATHADGAVVKGVKQRAAATLQAAGLGRLATSSFINTRFVINDAGRAILYEALIHADEEAARYLGNANAAHEKGRANVDLMAKCQAWLDAANLLRRAGDDSDTVGAS